MYFATVIRDVKVLEQSSPFFTPCASLKKKFKVKQKDGKKNKDNLHDINEKKHISFCKDLNTIVI